MTRDQVFISYSHADSEWLERLQTMLAPLQRQGTLDVWADTRIQPGQLWKEEIQKALARAKVAVLLVKPSFLASEFIHKDELLPLLEASRKEGLTILWVPVRPSLYKATTIAHFQAAYDPQTPLSMLPWAQQEAELVRIAEKLMAIQSLPSSPSPSSTSPPPLAAPPQRVWVRLLLIVMVLSVVGVASVYQLRKIWFEKAPVSDSSVSRDSVQRNGIAKSTEPKESPPVVPSPSQQGAEAKVLPPPSIENIPDRPAQQVQNLQKQTHSTEKMTKVTYVDGKEYILREFMFYSDPYFNTEIALNIDQDTDLLVRTGKHIWRTVKPVDIKSIEMIRKPENDAFQTNVVLTSGSEVIGETPQDIEETWLPGKLGVSGMVKTFGSREQDLWVTFDQILKIKSVGGPEFRVEIEKTNGQKAILKSVVFKTRSPSGFWERKSWYGLGQIPVIANGIDIYFDLTEVETLVFGDAGKIEVVMIDGNKGVVSFQSENEEKVTYIYGELDTGEILFDEIYSHGNPKVKLIHFIKGQ